MRPGVDVGEVGQPPHVVADLRHLRIEVVEDRAAAEDRLAELGAQPAERVGGGGQRQVQLDRVDLLGDVGQRLEERVELPVVTWVTSITWGTGDARLAGVGAGCGTTRTLLPNTVVALISAMALAGIRLT